MNFEGQPGSTDDVVAIPISAQPPAHIDEGCQSNPVPSETAPQTCAITLTVLVLFMLVLAATETYFLVVKSPNSYVVEAETTPGFNNITSNAYLLQDMGRCGRVLWSHILVHDSLLYIGALLFMFRWCLIASCFHCRRIGEFKDTLDCVSVTSLVVYLIAMFGMHVWSAVIVNADPTTTACDYQHGFYSFYMLTLVHAIILYVVSGVCGTLLICACFCSPCCTNALNGTE